MLNNNVLIAKFILSLISENAQLIHWVFELKFTDIQNQFSEHFHKWAMLYETGN